MSNGSQELFDQGVAGAYLAGYLTGLVGPSATGSQAASILRDDGYGNSYSGQPTGESWRPRNDQVSHAGQTTGSPGAYEDGDEQSYQFAPRTRTPDVDIKKEEEEECDLYSVPEYREGVKEEEDPEGGGGLDSVPKYDGASVKYDEQLGIDAEDHRQNSTKRSTRRRSSGARSTGGKVHKPWGKDGVQRRLPTGSVTCNSCKKYDKGRFSGCQGSRNETEKCLRYPSVRRASKESQSAAEASVKREPGSE